MRIDVNVHFNRRTPEKGKVVINSGDLNAFLLSEEV